MNRTELQPMNIALISYMHGKGGIQTHTRFLAEGLRERGHTVRVISPAPMAAHCHSEDSPDFQVYSSLLSLVSIIREFAPNVAMVTGTGWKSMLGVLTAGQSCRKVFFEVMSGARVKFADPRLLSRFGFDAIIGQGVPVTKRFVREFGWRGRAETIPALPEPLERQFSIPSRLPRSVKDGIRFAYFGRLEPSKNVRLLIESFSEFADDKASLDIWGSGSDAEALFRLIEAHKLNKRVSLRGPYPEGQAYVELLQCCDLLLLPTVAEEGAPLVLLEAMACGLPFVANGMGGIPDYANSDCLITDGDIAKFIPSVRAMVARLESGDIDFARLQAHYHRHFSFIKLIDRWDAFLKAA